MNFNDGVFPQTFMEVVESTAFTRFPRERQAISKTCRRKRLNTATAVSFLSRQCWDVATTKIRTDELLCLTWQLGRERTQGQKLLLQFSSIA